MNTSIITGELNQLKVQVQNLQKQLLKQQASVIQIKQKFKDKYRQKITKVRDEYQGIINTLKFDLERIQKNYATQMMEINEYKMNMKARLENKEQ